MKKYVIVNLKSSPLTFFGRSGRFTPSISNAARLTLEEGDRLAESLNQNQLNPDLQNNITFLLTKAEIFYN